MATIGIVAPVSRTPRYSRPPSGMRTQIIKSVDPPEGPCQNAAGQVASEIILAKLLGHANEA